MLVRAFEGGTDLQAVRECVIELQDFERGMDDRLTPGVVMADAYLEGLFRRCEEFAGRLFVADVAGSVVGFVAILGALRSDDPEESREPYGYVDDLVVLPQHRATGYGQALLSRAEEYAVSCGRRSIRLRVKAGNHRVRGFYARNGYAEYELELEKPMRR